ncbi:MAG TPA: hypothetical protein VH600_11075 [Burkholderiales bacterium]|jgi:hypothetical protein
MTEVSCYYRVKLILKPFDFRDVEDHRLEFVDPALGVTRPRPQAPA